VKEWRSSLILLIEDSPNDVRIRMVLAENVIRELEKTNESSEFAYLLVKPNYVSENTYRKYRISCDLHEDFIISYD